MHMTVAWIEKYLDIQIWVTAGTSFRYLKHFHSLLRGNQ